jgi:hypothetical protein
MISGYDTTPPDPEKYGKGWEFKVPGIRDEYFASDHPWRRMRRGHWKPHVERFEGKRWSRADDY